MSMQHELMQLTPTLAKIQEYQQLESDQWHVGNHTRSHERRSSIRPPLTNQFKRLFSLIALVVVCSAHRLQGDCESWCDWQVQDERELALKCGFHPPANRPCTVDVKRILEGKADEMVSVCDGFTVPKKVSGALDGGQSGWGWNDVGENEAETAEGAGEAEEEDQGLVDQLSRFRTCLGGRQAGIERGIEGVRGRRRATSASACI